MADSDVDLNRAKAAAALVQADKGLVSRKIFADEEIYQIELKQIFGRAWLYRNGAEFMAAPDWTQLRETHSRLEGVL